jgi:hypothetical protein
MHQDQKFVIPFPLLRDTVQYLGARPYFEVEGIMAQLKALPTLREPAVPAPAPVEPQTETDPDPAEAGV